MIRKKRSHDRTAVDALKIIDESTPFAVKEAFNSLATNVIYLPITDRCKKIAITSSVSGEGKTYISINLSIVLAKNLTDKKVLLIDMDIRSPRISKLFKSFSDSYNSNEGLSEYLIGISDKPNIVSTNIPGLSILFAGGESSNPAGLINSQKMTEFLKKCEEEYDYIIIDTPPINIVSDATLLNDRVNGYIITTRSEYSTTRSLAVAEELLNSVGAHIFGVVLTAYNPKKGRKYGYSYDYKYSKKYYSKYYDNSEK